IFGRKEVHAGAEELAELDQNSPHLQRRAPYLDGTPAVVPRVGEEVVGAAGEAGTQILHEEAENQAEEEPEDLVAAPSASGCRWCHPLTVLCSSQAGKRRKCQSRRDPSSPAHRRRHETLDIGWEGASSPGPWCF